MGKIEKIDIPSKFLKLFRVHFNRNGVEGKWDFISRKNKPEAAGGERKADAVVIVPYHIAADGKMTMVVTEEYRHPIGDYEWSFPAGLIDEGETAIEAAKRELFEETGLQTYDVGLVTPNIYSSAGMTDESVQYVVLTCYGEPSGDNREETEDINVHFLNHTECFKLTQDTEKKVGAKTWSFLLFAGPSPTPDKAKANEIYKQEQK